MAAVAARLRSWTFRGREAAYFLEGLPGIREEGPEHVEVMSVHGEQLELSADAAFASSAGQPLGVLEQWVAGA